MVESATLNEAIMMQPGWLRAWLILLVSTNLAAVLFVAGRQGGKWIFRVEAMAILAAFFAAGAYMNYLYSQFGYVRILGLAHLVFWGPVYAWIWTRRELYPRATLFGKYLMLYFVIDGISLVVDAVDLIRYFVGI